MALENETPAADKQQQQQKRRRKRRWGEATTAAAVKPPPSASATASAADPMKSKILAMQESVRSRLAAAKAAASGTTAAPPVKRAKHYELNMDVTGPTYNKEPSAIPKSSAAEVKSAPAKKKKANANPYLAHQDDDGDDGQEEEVEDVINKDDRLSNRTSKPRLRHKSFRFTEAGHWREVAERVREKAALAEASGFVSGRKTGHTVKSTGITSGVAMGGLPEEVDGSLLPRADAKPDGKMPMCVEWWDMELLPSKLKKQVAEMESKALTQQTKSALRDVGKPDGAETGGATPLESTTNASDKGNEVRRLCAEQARLSYSKTAALVQHIVPIKPPNAYDGPPKEPVLQLTKKELKRQRKLRRQEKQRELQDLQAAGLIPAPEPRLTLSNFIQVLGDQAYVDPSQMEKKVQEQIEARQRAHIERNEAKKLTKEQRSAKRTRKLEEDTSTGVHVAVYYVKDLSHPYHRAKVDLNAQQNNLSGGVIECEVPQAACVICEGGPKAIKRYTRLMLVRMKWTGPDEEEEEEEMGTDEATKTQKFRSDNTCSLVWEGMAVRPSFKGFFFQACETSDQARKVLKAKGVEHYWDQVVEHASGRLGFQVRLGGDESDDDGNPYALPVVDEDVEMAE